jgi:hypothetical protein
MGASARRALWPLVAALLIAGPAHAQDATVPESPYESSGEAPEDSWLVPSLHGLGLMTAMRIGEAMIWPEPFANPSLSRMGDSYADAFTHWPRWDSSQPAFQWDGDDLTINVVGHGLFGSELYLRARTCRRKWWEAALLTTAGSVLWEYGFEASAVRPSAQDLWFTPVAGLVLGEARYLGWHAASSIPDPLWRSMLTSLLDPFGEIERALGTPC